MSLTAMKIPFKDYLAITKTSKNKWYHFYPQSSFSLLLLFLTNVFDSISYACLIANTLHPFKSRGDEIQKTTNWFKQIGSMLYLRLVLSNKWFTVLHNLFGIFILVISAWNILAKIVNVEDWNSIRGINCLRTFC